MSATNTIRRPALRYFGGKWRMAPFILKHLPPHRCYVEPFGGAASVLLRKSRSRVEVYNDLDGSVVRFFRVLRERPTELIRAIKLTPFARAEFELSRDLSAVDDIEAARRIYVRCWQSMHAGLGPNRTGWRHSKGRNRLTSAADEFSDVSMLWPIADRLRSVHIECDAAAAVIARFDTTDTLFYVDPPYHKDTRSHRWGCDGYACELDEVGHAALLRQLLSVSGMVVLSGYRHASYDKELAAWRRVDRDVVTFRAGTATECIWISPAAAGRLWPMGVPPLAAGGVNAELIA